MLQSDAPSVSLPCGSKRRSTSADVDQAQKRRQERCSRTCWLRRIAASPGPPPAESAISQRHFKHLMKATKRHTLSRRCATQTLSGMRRDGPGARFVPRLHGACRCGQRSLVDHHPGRQLPVARARANGNRASDGKEDHVHDSRDDDELS